ncbi:hypothetical protein AB0E27_14985 [Streptomyces sparsogenes]|uniref:hypothetical protein n=1 Tax=Streptomyces sparsogenes TaxID=67365 RepID=UPI003403A8B9
MRPDQTLVTLQREGTRITARTSEPFIQEAAAGTSEHDHPYSHLTVPLRQRGLSCTVEYGLSDHIVHAELPDGSALIISPPQEPPTDHPPGYPESWLVTRGHPDDSTLHEVIYDSEPDGPHARHGGSIPRLLTAIDTRLDQLGLPPRLEPRRPAHESGADAVLHRAGFVPVVLFRERFHRLPSAMTDPVEQRQMVTLAVDMLQAEGFDVSCDTGLLDPSLPPPGHQGLSLGDRLGHLTQSIRSAAHTGEVVAALSELTAPGGGVLQRVVESLNTTADWREGLGEPSDPCLPPDPRPRPVADRRPAWSPPCPAPAEPSPPSTAPLPLRPSDGPAMPTPEHDPLPDIAVGRHPASASSPPTPSNWRQAPGC